MLTLGFYDDVPQGAASRKRRTARSLRRGRAQLLGAPVSIRCIIAERPARAPGKSPLVQHAVENHGANDRLRRPGVLSDGNEPRHDGEDRADAGSSSQKAQADLAEKRAEGTSGGGAVHIVLTGGMKVDSLKIDKEVVDPDDVEMLEDLLTAALNEVLQKVQSLQMGQLAGLAGSLGLGGIPGLQ